MSVLSLPEQSLQRHVVFALWQRELQRFLRDRSQIFGGVSRTTLWLIILGYGLGGALRDIEGYTYAQYILAGVITLNILFASLQSAMALVWDRRYGLLRQIFISPASLLSVALGKLLGGATVAVLQGCIPLLFAPILGVRLGLLDLLLVLGVMFVIGISLTGLGIMVASRIQSLEGFGSISNGVIQPLYFLSGAIFPLKGIVGGIGFLDLPDNLRDELRRLGVHAVGGGWLVELPTWLSAIVHLNPLSYPIDILRGLLLGFRQMPELLSYGMLSALPLAGVLAAVAGMRVLAGER